jgi:hypothetical protein
MASENSDERISKRASASEARADRLSLDRPVTENRENTDADRSAERYAMLRDTNTLLPVPPEMPGFHLVWLTTTNTKDTIEQRQRLGYTLVKPSELPDFALHSQKSGTVTEDRIQINEMILAKIPLDLFIKDMTYLHHIQPKDALDNLRNSVRIGRDGRGRDVAYTGGEFNSGNADGYAQTRLKSPNLAGLR